MSGFAACRALWVVSLLIRPAFAAEPGPCTRYDRPDAGLPAYEATPLHLPRNARYIGLDGEVTVVGYNDMDAILRVMAAGFREHHPDIRFHLDLRGTRLAPAALAEGRSAFAPMGALMTLSQLALFSDRGEPPPLAIRVGHASLDPAALTGPLAIFVHRDNPLETLTLAQAAAVFSGAARTWRDLGVSGPLGSREIHVYGLQPATVLAQEFQRAVMAGGAFDPAMVAVPQSAEVSERVENDALGIGFGAAMRVGQRSHALALSTAPGAEASAPTCAAILAGQYGLDRFLLIYLKLPISPMAREFVRFALSRDGQMAVAASPQHYLPLSPTEAGIERAKLENAGTSILNPLHVDRRDGRRWRRLRAHLSWCGCKQ